MIQSQARTVLTNLRADIARRGYDHAEKRHLAVLFNDIKHAYSSTSNKAFDPDKWKEVDALEKKWQEDRRNYAGGADTIGEIIAEIEMHIPVLATEIKSNVIVMPSIDELAADRMLAVLKQRGAAVSV